MMTSARREENHVYLLGRLNEFSSRGSRVPFLEWIYVHKVKVYKKRRRERNKEANKYYVPGAISEKANRLRNLCSARVYIDCGGVVNPSPFLYN